jgi:hypothetical protein
VIPRKPIVPAGQPLPPQPSANEISPEALAKVSEVEKKAKKLTLMELTERTCKWPIGDPATEDFWFCGLPVQQGKPYCEAHVGVAFQPMSARRDRRRGSRRGLPAPTRSTTRSRAGWLPARCAATPACARRRWRPRCASRPRPPR